MQMSVVLRFTVQSVFLRPTGVAGEMCLGGVSPLDWRDLPARGKLDRRGGARRPGAVPGTAHGRGSAARLPRPGLLGSCSIMQIEHDWDANYSLATILVTRLPLPRPIIYTDY